MAFFRSEMDFFSGQNLEIENPSFETCNSSFNPDIQFWVFSAIADCYPLVFYKAQQSNPNFELFLSYLLQELGIWKLRFSIPRFRPEEKQPRIEEMNSWFTLIGPLWSTSVIMLLYLLILYTMYKIDHYTHILPAAKIMLLNRASKLQCQPPCFC